MIVDNSAEQAENSQKYFRTYAVSWEKTSQRQPQK